MQIKTDKDEEIRWRGALNGIPAKLQGVYKAYAFKILGSELTQYLKDEQYLLELHPNKFVEIQDKTKVSGRKNCSWHQIFSGIRSINEEIKPEFVQLKQTSGCPGGEIVSDGNKNELKTYCFFFEDKYLIQQECSPECRNPFMKTGLAQCKTPDSHYFVRVSPLN